MENGDMKGGRKKKTRQVRDKGSNCYIRQLLLWLVFISESTTSGCLTTRDIFGFLNSYNPKKLETRGEREDGKPSAALLPGRFRSGASKHFSRQTRAALDLLCSNLLRSVIYIYMCGFFVVFWHDRMRSVQLGRMRVNKCFGRRPSPNVAQLW